MKKLIIIFISILIFISLLIINVSNNNLKYERSIINDIKYNYTIVDSIKYVNKSNNCYIVLTNNNLILLSDNYKELFKEDINNLSHKKNNYDIVYRLNKIMYETKTIKKNKIEYTYIDIYSGDIIDSIQVGG